MEDKLYITTPIFYVNDKPHIGHAYTSIAADAMARWGRLRGWETFFLTGTDEHGTKVARSAEAAGKPVDEFVDGIAETFKSLKDTLDLSWDKFIRTSDKKEHWPGAQALWRKLEESGDIYEGEYKGLYCVGCEAFIKEKDLVNGLCPDHKKEPELIEEKNLFFRLSKYAPEIKKAIESGELDIQPESRRNEILALIDGGLEDVSFSRPKEKLSWGIPVPGHEDQTMYVWCDALTNYISAVGYGRNEKEFKKWWPADIHVLGKDILRFHAAIWPGMLLSAGLPLPKHIFVHGFITSEGNKMSKSIGNVIDPVELVEKYGSDVLRYYLLREIPSNEDGDFSIKRFEERYNSDLANGLGNFASRVSTLGENRDFTGFEVDGEIVEEVNKTVKEAAESANKFRLHETVARVWALIQYGDGYVNEHKPWENKDEQIIFNLVFLLHSIANLVKPIVPKASAKIESAIELEDGKIVSVKKVENLFPRLEK
ncbi:MAG: Methionine-tRNA ligase [Parcubacteria group bacterium GW2011_GWB1_43_8b]|nr:MAG: Methionine-tRNA ligase [Parcubacteria group bacterium GW2011_GWB1_43_8b]